ncbi:amino acid aminotransferase [Herbaspirillum sp. RTI4]|uniref:amino acid aminotransferase n=1 Tax=Herbaspirillum sp. RTI4 TaxID=3048640 RepID=UPI002AB40FB0|nr:amino acid aminotransferase [Herbaspirillum sp. RTI4]MDY7578151.1 amino acid aminotransferase [Herbaspirillum sp. RTI4]MEA9980740.1 amino acid aminotransferase [Herbaspirillum sp. RTI4]
MFAHLPPYAGDPILGLMDVYRRDPRPEKANLGIGIYTDENGVVPILPSVLAVSAELQAAAAPYTYLPMEGLASYRQAVAELIFGDALPDEAHLAVVQTPGGSGALKVGADFLHRFFPTMPVWIPDPTWDNHIGIFEGAGVEVQRYPYYDAATGALAFDKMLDCFDRLAPGTLVLLHPCCHNPTGIDPDRAQWTQIIDLLERRRLLPFFDLAYQGFAENLEQDVWPVRECVRRGMNFLLANSFSKIFSLYGERCGALSVFCPADGQATNVLGQLKQSIRRNYSSPPMHGAMIVSHILHHPELRRQWEGEVAHMRERIRHMRVALHAGLSAALPDRDVGFLLRQNGMFGYTGLSEQQVERLRERHAVYAIATGRICLAGVNQGNLAHVCAALAEVMHA